MARPVSSTRPALPVIALAACAMLAGPGHAADGAQTAARPAVATHKGIATLAKAEATDAARETDNGKIPEVLQDVGLLPKPVARLREQIIEAAYSGDIERLRPILEANGDPPVVSFGDASVDPIAFWKAASGDGEGREILAIMIEVLEADFVRIEKGTPEELYVWPYFAQYPLGQLTPAQEVELYKLVTAQDKQDMDQFGAYNFYRAGISPDGRWRYFVAGD